VLQRALTWSLCETGESPSLDDTVLPYHSMNGALISNIRSQSMQTTWAIWVFCSRFGM
jgi:hypothetical protein